MYVLHAIWSPGFGAMLWAEDSEPAVTSPSQALRQARPHPFAASTDVLQDLVGGTPTTIELLLPSARRSPLDSAELVRFPPRSPSRTPASLLAWRVPAVHLEPLTLRTALARALDADDEDDLSSGTGSGVRTFHADARPAASLRYLADLADYSADLVDRGRVIPLLDTDTDGARARWHPVLTGPDAVAAHALITTMPPAFRATELAIRPDTLASEALVTLTDALVRERLPESLLPPRRGRRPARPPVTEAWLAALTGPDPTVAADPSDLAGLARGLHPWVTAGRESPGPAQLVLRLTDPRSTDPDPDPTGPDSTDPGSTGPDSDPDTSASPAPASWRLEFLLRSRLDPSLVIDAPRVWADDGTLGRWLERPREALLAELARAQRLYPELEAGLRQARPAGLSLDADAAYAFLTVAATALDAAGFEVQLPGWWGRRDRLGLKLSTTPSDTDDNGSHFGRDQLSSFNWELAVGEHGLTDDEIAALAEAKAPLVRLRGEWVAIDPVQLKHGLKFLNSESSGELTAAQILALALSHPDDLDLPLPLVDVAAGGWLGDMLAGTASETIAEIAPPDDFTATLRPYQSRGLGWLDFLGRLGLGACLADDMGLGKTVQLLALEATARAAAGDPDHPGDGQHAATLLLCPVSLVSNWQAEAKRFAPSLQVVAHHGTDRAHGDALTALAAASDLVITTYTTAMNDIEELAEIEWERIVLDEAQAIKNRLSRTAKAVRQLRGGQRIALTGTPVENRLTELWSIMDFLNPGVLNSPELFKARFATPIERRRDQDAAGLLRRVTRPYILRRVKTDPTIIDDLPEKIEIKQYYRLTVEQASLYQSVVDDMMRKIENTRGIERRGNVLAAMTKLKQICNHPAQLLHDRSSIGRRSGKILRLEEILEEILAEGDRVLCFTQFTEFAELLIPHLAARFDTDIAYLSGSTPRPRRAALVERFQSGDGPPIFLLSLKAGGTGLNLTAANHVLHLDRWWNPAVENQATDRAFRIGQKRSVQVRKFIGTGTLEERIDAMIEGKMELANLVVGEGESWLTELSSGQLRDLFALSEEAIGE